MAQMTPGKQRQLMAHINKLKAKLNAASATRERVELQMRIAALTKLKNGK